MMYRGMYAVIIGVTGLLIVGFNSNWLVAIGLFLMAYSHNLEKH